MSCVLNNFLKSVKCIKTPLSSHSIINEPEHDKTNKKTFADAQVDRSLRWAHMSFCWFCHVLAQLVHGNMAPLAISAQRGSSVVVHIFPFLTVSLLYQIFLREEMDKCKFYQNQTSFFLDLHLNAKTKISEDEA